MIIIYGMSGCGFCRMAVDKCKKYNLGYEYRDIGYSKWYKEFKKLGVNLNALPQVIIPGMSPGNYDSLNHYIECLLSTMQQYEEGK